MNERLRPDEAARALTEIEQRQEQVIEVALTPAWFWWVNAGLMVGLSAAVESRRPLVIGIGTAVFVTGVLAATGRVVIGALRRAQLRNRLLPPVGVLAILAFVAAILAASLPTSFALDAAGVRYPATCGVLLGATVMAVGGPLLMRYLRRLMLAGRVGGQR